VAVGPPDPPGRPLSRRDPGPGPGTGL